MRHLLPDEAARTARYMLIGLVKSTLNAAVARGVLHACATLLP
jgi:hypothetical protein